MFPTGHRAGAGRWGGLGCWLLVLGVGTCLPPGHSHETLAGFVQHDVLVALNAEYLDVTVHLTFFEDGSEHEREDMDADGDGSISRSETGAYVRRLERELANAVRLRVDGRPVALTLLREPELDLLGWAHAGRWHHRLSLHWFAPTPAGLIGGAGLELEDRLWPGWPAVGRLDVSARDGARLRAEPMADSLLPPVRPGKPRLFKVRLLAPPRTPETDRHPQDLTDSRNPVETP